MKRGATMADSAEQVMIGVRMLLTDRGVQRGELFADTAYVFDDQTRFELRKVRATFNTATGTKDGVLSADRGRYNQRDGEAGGIRQRRDRDDGRQAADVAAHAIHCRRRTRCRAIPRSPSSSRDAASAGSAFTLTRSSHGSVVLKAGEGRGNITLPAQ